MRGKALIRLWLLSVAIGIVDVIALKLFEDAVNGGTHWLWNDVFHTNTERWGVVPLAIGLSILLTALIMAFRQNRLAEPRIDLLKEQKSAGKPTLRSMAILLAIGLGSLLAGASLGPEASLMAFASSFGIWAALRFKADSSEKLLAMASTGGLLVGFLGSIIPVLLPIFLLYKAKQLKLASVISVLIAGGSAFASLWVVDRKTSGFGSIPIGNNFSLNEFILVVVLGFVAAFLGWLLKQTILKSFKQLAKLSKKVHWITLAAISGLVIGLLYWLGGESTQFSGNKGTDLLLSHKPAYGLGALVVILVVKILVTGWSSASGYRGGLVFPSIYVGVVIGEIAHSIFSRAEPGIVIGSIAGIVSAMTGSLIGLVFMLSILPLKFIVLVIPGIIGATVGNKTIAHYLPDKAVAS